MCDSKELIVGFIYDELTSTERQQLQAHLAMCGECRVEVEELRATRTHLALWWPPQPDLGFRVISGASAPVQALPRPRRLAPLFAFAAAAAIVLAAAAALANIEIRYGSDGLTVRTGWGTQSQVASQSAQLTQAPAVQGVNTATFADFDRRLSTIESALTPASSSMQLASSQLRMSDAEVLRQMREMLNEAQAQQKSAFQNQMVQIVRDVQRQHLADIANIQQGLEQYQGLTNAEIATSRDMLNQWIRASARQEK